MKLVLTGAIFRSSVAPPGLATFPSIKICLSGRPWPVFEDAFKSCPSLRLQDLTRKDITLYVDEEASTDYTNITNDIDFSINHHVKFLHRTV
jgi:hypothetical protein